MYLGKRGVANHDEGGVVGFEPLIVEANQVVARDLRDGGRVARAGERNSVSVIGAVEEGWQHAQRHADGLNLLLLNGSQLQPLLPLKVCLRERWIQNDVGVQVKRRIELRL